MSELRKYVKGEGKDWNANDKIAWGAGAVHEDFKDLQLAINNFGGALGFALLKVDGFFGPATAGAVKSIYDAVVKKNPLLTATPFPVPDTKEEVAEFAQFIRGWLAETAAKALGIPPMRRYAKGTGHDWNANESIAWGSGDVEADFKHLQADLNHFTSLGFAKLDEDGKLGGKSVAAIKAVYEAVVKKNALFAATPFPVPDTKEEVAEYAQFIRAWLRGTASTALAVTVA
jgi:lysozyme family protein